MSPEDSPAAGLDHDSQRLDEIETRLTAIQETLHRVEELIQNLVSQKKKVSIRMRGQSKRRISYTPASPEECLQIRERKGLTQKQAAELLGTSIDNWRNWEYGRSRPSSVATTIIKQLLQETTTE